MSNLQIPKVIYHFQLVIGKIRFLKIGKSDFKKIEHTMHKPHDDAA
jgi:hypothetical protein